MSTLVPTQLVLFAVLAWLVSRLRRTGGVELAGISLAALALVALAHLAVTGVDLLLGPSTVESAVARLLPGVDHWIPLSALGMLGRAGNVLLVTAAFAMIVAALRWATLTGGHLEEADRAQSRARWLRLAGRTPSGALPPELRSALGPLVAVLAAALVATVTFALVTAGSPSGGDWAIAELVLITFTLNLLLPGPPSATQPAAPAPALAPADPPSEPLAERVSRALRAAGLQLDAHPLRLVPGSGWSHVDELARRGGEGRSALLLGPRHGGRTSAIVRAAETFALDRFENVLVLTGDDASAERLRARIARAIDDRPVPRLVGVVCPTDDSGRLGLGEPTIVVLAAFRLGAALRGAHGVSDAFFETLDVVMVDDLDRFDAHSASALSRSLAALRKKRLVVGELTCLATATPRGDGAELWARTILGVSVEVFEAAPPRPPMAGFVLRGGANAFRQAAAALARAEISHATEDAVHADRLGPSLAPWPAIPVVDQNHRSQVVLVALRSRDLALATSRFAPVGPHSEAVFIACPLDEPPPKNEVPRWVPLTAAAEPDASITLVAEPDGRVLGDLAAPLAQLIAPPRARLVIEATAFRVRRRSDSQILVHPAQATDTGHVSLERAWQLLKADPIAVHQLEIPKLDLSVRIALQHVDVHAETHGIRTIGSDSETRERLEPPLVTRFQTVGVELSSAGLAPTSYEQTLARALDRATTLREDEIAVVAATNSVWILDLAVGGNGASRWLVDHCLTEYAFWAWIVTPDWATGPQDDDRNASGSRDRYSGPRSG